ncbi:ribosome hibernation-promoting factor, HPF/YfiA family [Roseibacillus persicicus]|uniref:Ribosome hibernation promoting factor n=1 Tax=Roseibacillus persicicus TaxID=454148 RepID=A0A918TMM8_9BACT|nr:ribosome-associated translation inhibitor RaiA [Roseibacillus persicicus]MDQ8192582.1 ribosome-associated translation inhibitor RaiA [Roseibacillus persicicus]GHC55061.1 ribosomal subunit interface protein [Roseibacillus persicicus]
MKTANADAPVTVTVRHEESTDSLREYATSKIDGLSLDYPRIIEAKAILDVQKNRHIAEILLFCADHIVIEASSESEDMYKSIDLTIDKIARRMRKHKTRLLKKHRPKPENTIKHLEEKWYNDAVLDHPEESTIDPEPLIVHREGYRLRTLFKEEAIMELELSEKPFVLFKNARRNINQLVYRRKDGEYALIELPVE